MCLCLYVCVCACVVIPGCAIHILVSTQHCWCKLPTSNQQPATTVVRSLRTPNHAGAIPITLTPLEQLLLYWFTAVGPEAYGAIGSRSSEVMAPLAVVLQRLMAQLAVDPQRLMAPLAVVLQRHIVQLAVVTEAYYYRPTSSRSPEVYRPTGSAKLFVPEVFSAVVIVNCRPCTQTSPNYPYSGQPS